ncbi:proline-rich protein 19-like [Larus michahellis]|uniref:proline-rich protein 19-like n=1 Tax=Larus michahellis TaxID=119627 RepID=UPI003D9BE44F
MSRRRGRGDVGEAGDPHPRGGPHPPVPVPIPVPGRVKRRKTKRERDSAKFGRKIPGGFRWGAGPPPRRLLPPWGGRPAASPLPLPKTVVITQNRLCQHRGMFNREVKSVDVERLLSPRDAAPHDDTPEGDPEPGPPDPPPSQGVPAELAGRLRALLGGTRMFSGRDLVGERRGAILAALLRRHRSLPDLGLLLAHRRWGADAAPPGPWSPQTPERAPRGSAEGGDFGGQKQSWDPTPPSGSTPAPLRAFVSRTPSPIFGGDGKKRETPFSWSSGEEEEEEEEEDGGCPDSPAPLFQPHTPSWGDPRWHGGALPGSPPLRARGGPPFAPRPTPAPFGEGRSWSHRPPIAPPAFGPLPLRLGQPPAPRHPDPRRGGNPHPPRTPDRWSPEPSCHGPGSITGRPR